MIGPLGRLGAAATLGQHCPQMTQRRCNMHEGLVEDRVWSSLLSCRHSSLISVLVVVAL